MINSGGVGSHVGPTATEEICEGKAVRPCIKPTKGLSQEGKKVGGMFETMWWCWGDVFERKTGEHPQRKTQPNYSKTANNRTPGG